MHWQSIYSFPILFGTNWLKGESRLRNICNQGTVWGRIQLARAQRGLRVIIYPPCLLFLHKTYLVTIALHNPINISFLTHDTDTKGGLGNTIAFVSITLSNKPVFYKLMREYKSSTGTGGVYGNTIPPCAQFFITKSLILESTTLFESLQSCCNMGQLYTVC